jgi:hypothetical protein
MPSFRRLPLVAVLALGAALLAPSTAPAATGASVVNATVGSELSLAIAVPAPMILTHSTAGSASSLVTVTSTQLSWTLSIADSNTGANAGHMLKAADGTPLQNALLWSADNSTFSALSGTPATVGTGSLVGTKMVYFRQPLAPTESVATGDNYTLTVAYTVT